MNDQASQMKERLDLALSAAREAGRLTLEFFQRESLRVERKSDDSPVTEADLRAEELLRERIRAAFPEDAIVGEELAEQKGTSGFRWIVDPIDGTKSFISGVPLYTTLVGIEHEGRSKAGVIFAPALEECVYAARGQGAWHVQGGAEPRPAKVSECKSLAQGLCLTSEVGSFYDQEKRAVCENLHAAARLSRTWGDAYGYMLVATGRADVMVDPVMNLWDAAALLPVLEEAGGTFTDWQGNARIDSGSGIGTNGHLLAEVLAITNL